MRVNRIVNNASDNELVESVDLNGLSSLIEKYKNKKGNLIPLLQGVQSVFGYIPKDAFYLISKETGIPLSNIYGVATFYSQFRLVPAGKYIVKVCHGTACHVLDAPVLTQALEEVLNVKDGESTEDMLFTLESVACLGCCSLAPVMMIADETYGNLNGKSAVKVIKQIKRNEQNL